MTNSKPAQKTLFQIWNEHIVFNPSLADSQSYIIRRRIQMAFLCYLLIPVARSCIFFIFFDITFTTLRSYNSFWTNITIVAHDIWRGLCAWYDTDLLEWFWNLLGAWKPIVQVILKGLATYAGAYWLFHFQ